MLKGSFVMVGFLLIYKSHQCFYYPPASNFKDLGLLGEDIEYKHYWKLPPQGDLEDSDEEAVMIIGGKMCMKTKCLQKYSRFGMKWHKMNQNDIKND